VRISAVWFRSRPYSASHLARLRPPMHPGQPPSHWTPGTAPPQVPISTQFSKLMTAYETGQLGSQATACFKAIERRIDAAEQKLKRV
jgi:hypothetical protein